MNNPKAPMEKLHKKVAKFHFLIIAVLAFLSAITIERNIESLDAGIINISHFQTVLDGKFNKASEKLEQISSIIGREGLHDFIRVHGDRYFDLFDEDGIVVLILQDNELRYWNSNILPLQINEFLPEEKEGVINPGNGWYAITRLQEEESLTLLGLILIKYDYVFENNFLINDFHDDFKMFPDAGISPDNQEGNKITGPDGRFIFSLIIPDELPSGNKFSLLASLLFSLSAILLLFFLYNSFSLFRFKSIASKNYWFLAVSATLLLARYIMLEFSYPDIFRSFSLFHPHHYAKSSLFPSLGDLLINSVLLLFLTICFSVHFNIFDRKGEPNNRKNIFSVAILNLFLVFWLFFFHWLFSGLIFNSNIQLEVYNFFYLTRFSFVAYLILAILIASVVIFADRVIFLSSTLVELKIFIWLFALSFSSGVLILSLAGNTVNIYAILFFIALIASISCIRYFRYRYTYSFQLLLVFLISLFTMAFITSKSMEKEKNIRQVLAVNLANERDQVAEFMFEKIEVSLRNDSLLRSSLSTQDYDDWELYDYLAETYFTGYFGNYEMQIAFCGPGFDLLLEDINEIVDCYTFFYEIIGDFGVPVSANSGFFFLNNLNARISYLGIIIYVLDEYPFEKTLFISLDSKLMNDQLGYPELLIEGGLQGNPHTALYSTAKYIDNRLVSRSGIFPYPLTMQFEHDPESEFTMVKKNGYDHLVYHIGSGNISVLSKPKIRTIDLLTSFSYSFVFFYLLYGLALLFCKYPLRIKRWQIDFKNKIKFSMIGVLLLSLILIGIVTVYYNIRQFEKQQYESISEKIQSVLIELEYRHGHEAELTPGLSYHVTGGLIQLSNVFYSDINMYDLSGNLYASSRPEVFDLGLIGEQMNPAAYSEMLMKQSARFVHKETISNLSYLSAYVPLTNYNNEIISYLNLPYFTRQSILTKEIYTLVVAVANIYAILLLISTFIAVIVSNTITKPLQLIQNRLRELSIGKKNEHIYYESDDEIGNLIREYNRMVDELERSAELLARSEREGAWREMAKQIAHEIKNPLTPMKLSIQHLQRSWEDRTENWDDVLKRTTHNLVEQIDHLSSIATAFSNFAKLPGTKPDRVNIVQTINNIAGLFSNNENIDISLNLNNIFELYVISDRTQLNRVFVNLLKNSVQSIPVGRKGKISIELEAGKEMATVKITDNGKGIPPELMGKMFTPNFTTKSGGTGLGLAIVKNIVEQSGGTVGFTTEHQKGSCFFFKLPFA